MAELRVLRVEDAGMLTTVQDLGRPGHAHLGVPRSGAVDPDALRLGNRLVGNPESAAGLETTATGGAFGFAHAVAIAVTGAQCEVRVDGRAVAWGAAVPVPAGSVVRLGRAPSGLRAYLTVSGGITVPPVLGSRATDLLSGLGPAPLRDGDELPVGPPFGEPSGSEAVERPRPGTVELVLGPRQDWFTERSLRALDGATYEVLPASNRIGVRLGGPAIEWLRPGEELASEPMVLGALQVPPNGQPVVFLHDHPTTGGYPVVAVVRPDDLVVCAQAAPGDRIRFRVR